MDNTKMQQILPLNNLQEVINNPEVVKAIGVLLAAGLLFTPQRATIFCAYCGKHICFDARIGDDDVSGSKSIEPRQSEFTRNAVLEHRKTCATYRATRSAETELALIRDAARDASLSDAAVRVIANGLQEPTATDIEWAHQVTKKDA